MGEDDLWHPVEQGERFARDIQGARLMVLSECGHMPQQEKSKEVVSLVRDF
ncbi:hypothetical protein KJ693_03835 [bacterium]|nr:hypothetical protein [bacterium]